MMLCCVVPGGVGVWTCGCVWACGCVSGGGMIDAMGYKNTGKAFSTEFFDWRIQSKKLTFSTGYPRRKTQSEEVEPKKPFFDSVRKPDLGHFSTDKSDCVRNGLF